MSFHHPHDDSDSDDKRITGLQTQIDELRAQLTPTDAAATGVIIEKDPAPAEGLRFRPTELPEYNGKRENYPAWRSAVLLISWMDWNAFNYTDTRAFLAIYTSLKGDAQKKAGAFFEAGGVDVDKAADQLYGLRMGDTQRWASFYPTWAAKLTEAEGDLWNDRTKITMLKNALNDRLRHSLRGNHLPRANFLEWVRIVACIAQQVEEDDSRRQRGHQEERRDSGLRFRLNSSRRYDYADQAPSTAPQAAIGDTNGAGDIVMGGVNTALERRGQDGEETSRSRWKCPEEISRLRRERRCFGVKERAVIRKRARYFQQSILTLVKYELIPLLCRRSTLQPTRM
ncbi:hypothetical protein K3495_g2265 [Podosphaera aphanis]|nr:hypothetical protein K3495_g2265 [Podosphaera aphanis]